MRQNENNFFQPVISIIGLAISLISAVLPIFSTDAITKLFVVKQTAQPISFIAFVLGIAIIWQITEFQPYIQINIGPFKDRGRGYPEPWKSINYLTLFWILVVFAMIAALVFISINLFSLNNKIGIELGITQSVCYLLFFLTLITIFSLLFSQSKNRFNLEQNKELFPSTVFSTLERSRLIKPYIEIHENRPMDQQEALALNVINVGLVRKLVVRTQSQDERIIEFVASWDGKEIIKVVSNIIEPKASSDQIKM